MLDVAATQDSVVAAFEVERLTRFGADEPEAKRRTRKKDGGGVGV